MSYSVGIQLQGTTGLVVGSGINWAPAQGSATEILQNVKMILLTPIGAQVFDRKLGVSTDFVDEPIPHGMAMVQTLFAMAIRQFEPRFIMDGISFGDRASAENGKVIAIIVGHLDIAAIVPAIPLPTGAPAGTPTYCVDFTGDTPGVYLEVVSS
jgi:phage baseplate assembly protein W